MKIAQIISTPPMAWGTGGVARVVYELSKELVKRGHEVTILTSDMYKPGKHWSSRNNPEFVEGIQIFRFRYFSDKLAWGHKIVISPGIIRYLREHLHEYDIVHLQDLISIQAIATTRYCKNNGIPYILTTHGSIHWLIEKKAANLIFTKAWGSKILQSAKKVTAFTKIEFEQCKNMGVKEGNIELIPNGLDLSQYSDLPKKGEFRRKFQIAEDRKVILSLGRIEKTKGIDLLVMAFAIVSEKLENVLLVIAGPDDGYLSTLMRLIEDQKIGDKVLFTGLLDEQDKLKAYVDANVHVLPRAWEPFGLTLLEACSCGTPVICSKGCGIADFINGKVGFAVNYNKEDLSCAILNILSNDDLRIKFGEKGKILVHEQFNLSKIVDKIEKTYLSCLPPA